MDSLAKTLEEVRARIAKYRGRKVNEENTKATLIDPVLRALGWNVEDLEVVQHEFKIKRADKPVDYALLVGRTPRLFVEAKALGNELTDWKWAKQIMGYASVAGVPWVVLTNGNEYKIYNAYATVPVEKKLFRAFDLSSMDSTALETLSLLSREELEGKRIEGLWQAHFVDQQVRTVIEELFGTGDPDTSLVSLVKKRAKGLSPKEVKASLTRVRVDLDFPFQPAVIKPPIKRKTKETTAQHQIKDSRGTEVSLLSIIESKLIRAPLVLQKTYKGRRFSATVEVDGRVTFQGVKYDSLSAAGGMARGTVVDTPPGKKYPATNGWTFWQFTDHDGQVKEIDYLRQQYLQERGGRLRLVGKRDNV